MKKFILLFLLIITVGAAIGQNWPSPTYTNLTTKGNLRSTRTSGLYTFSLLNYGTLSGGTLSDGTNIYSYGAAFTASDTASGLQYTNGIITNNVYCLKDKAVMKFKRTNLNDNAFKLYEDSLTVDMNGIRSLFADTLGKFTFFKSTRMRDSLKIGQISDSVNLNIDGNYFYINRNSPLDNSYAYMDLIDGRIDMGTFSYSIAVRENTAPHIIVSGDALFDDNIATTDSLKTNYIAPYSGTTTTLTQNMSVAGNSTLHSNIYKDTCSASTYGIDYKGGLTWMHDFRHLTGSSARPVGYNIFLGTEAGNLTMGSTATSTTHASYNIGIGSGNALSTNGRVLGSCTTGNNNIAIGTGTLTKLTQGTNNIAMGSNALNSITSVSYNIALGFGSMQFQNSGSNNVSIGAFSGTLTGTTNPVSSNSIFIGYSSKPNSTSQANQIVIGYDVSGLGANTTSIGNSSTTLTKLYGDLQVSALGGAAIRYLTVAATTGQLIANDIVNYTVLQVSSTQDIVAATGITAAMTQLGGIVKIQGNGGASDISADPQIADGVANGHVIILKGMSDVNTVKLDDGTGLALAGGVSFTLGLGDIVSLYYDSTEDIWYELYRADN